MLQTMDVDKNTFGTTTTILMLTIQNPDHQYITETVGHWCIRNNALLSEG